MPQDKPNLLLITADQMRWDTMGCAGNPLIRTPNLDALALRGTIFRNAFTPNPICVPARAAIMTGNTPQVCTGCKGNSGRIREGQPLLTEILKSAGYRTYALGKLHFVPYSPPGMPRLVHGFEHVEWTESGRILGKFDPEGRMEGLEDYFDYLGKVGFRGYTRAHAIGNNDIHPCRSPLPREHTVDHWVADRTIEQMDRHVRESPDTPFFMWMSTPKPHSPYDPPDPYDRMYDPREISSPFGDESMLDDRNPYIEYSRMQHAQNTISPEARKVIKSYYYGCVSWIDTMIGRVFSHMRKLGISDNTVVLFTSDHGDLMGDFGTWFKCNHLNGSVRVPFIIAGPGIGRGISSDSLVGLEDILPTFASVAGAEIGQKVQGLDLLPALKDPSKTIRNLYYSSTLEGEHSSAMITDGMWKYIYSAGNATEELYDQKNDIGEIHNLARTPECMAIMKSMKAELIEKAIEMKDSGLLDNGELIRFEVDRNKYRSQRVGPSFGWRWY